MRKQIRRELPVDTNVYFIPERLREIDPHLRVTFFAPKQEYRVWGRDLTGPYILQSFPYLDARVVNAVRKGYNIAWSTGAPYRHLLRRQAGEEYEADKRWRKEVRDLQHHMNDDMKGLFRQLWPGWRCN